MNHMIIAAFFMSGLRNKELNVVLEAWDQGFVELGLAIVAYAPFAESLVEAAQSVQADNFPGVFEYEVSSPFGSWFGQYIIDHGDAPSEAAAKEFLAKECIAFFSHGLDSETGKAIERKILEALNQGTALASHQAPTNTTVRVTRDGA